MHFKRRGRHGRNDRSSVKRRQRENRIFKRRLRREIRYRLKRELSEDSLDFVEEIG